MIIEYFIHTLLGLAFYKLSTVLVYHVVWLCSWLHYSHWTWVTSH